MGTAIALGNFDGVHIAHKALVENMLFATAHKNVKRVVYLFEPHPRFLLFPSSPPRLLMETDLKVRRLLALGADEVFLEKRGMEILSLTPRDFVEKILRDQFGAEYVTAGFNYRFGKNAEGDAEMLKTLCKEFGIACEIMERVSAFDAPVSSSRLRALLEEGDISLYNKMSTAPYTIIGKVEEGKHLGRTLGFPTLNVPISPTLLLPKKGVYISRTKLLGKEYKGVTNVGHNPTVENAPARAETYLLDFSGEAYGETAETELLAFLRPETKFADISALQGQIQKDTEETRLYFERMNV